MLVHGLNSVQFLEHNFIQMYLKWLQFLTRLKERGRRDINSAEYSIYQEAKISWLLDVRLLGKILQLPLTQVSQIPQHCGLWMLWGVGCRWDWENISAQGDCQLEITNSKTHYSVKHMCYVWPGKDTPGVFWCAATSQPSPSSLSSSTGQ